MTHSEFGKKANLTAQEADRFENALHCFQHYLNLDHSHQAFIQQFDDYAIHQMPFMRLMVYVEAVGRKEFARGLLNATLDLYHDTHEWLVIFYSVALDLDEVCDFITEYLINGPDDHKVFILKVILKLEKEMTEQIAIDYLYTPFDMNDHETTRTLFDELYRSTLLKIEYVKMCLARRRLLL